MNYEITLERIILDLRELAGQEINNDAKEKLKEAINILQSTNIYSTVL